MNWHENHYNMTAEVLECDPAKGLSEASAKMRLAKYGPNKLDEGRKDSFLTKFFMQFNDFMILTLVVAAFISFAIAWYSGTQDFVDPIVILAIVVFNAILGMIQEHKAEKAISALKKMASPSAKVLREGQVKRIETEALVPGDVILLEAGDMVPADARLISASHLKTEESALTGESVPIEKDADYLAAHDATIGDRRNMVFSSSLVSNGRGSALVIATGMDTEVGRIAHMMMEDDAPLTPLQKRLDKTGKYLGTGALIICLLIFAMGFLRRMNSYELFMTSVSLAVAAIPEGLPAIVTIMLAIGVQRMAKRNAIIRRLPAVESLGSANVICSDKTGTLTQNKMTVMETWTAGKNPEGNKLLEYAALCNDAQLFGLSDPTETALVAAAFQKGIDKKKLDEAFPRVSELPFDSKRKLMTTIHKNKDGSFLVITKGAPDILAGLCTHYGENSALGQAKHQEIKRKNAEMAKDALRVLGVAYKTVEVYHDGRVEEGLTFLGLIGMIDPPRPEAKEAVKICKEAGIKPVMVTGDHVITAEAIARRIGIMGMGDLSITGDELNTFSQEELTGHIERYRVFARVTPEHKVRIVKAFQSRGFCVAMTGDGVNDAPALKAADIGCAMGISGTDVAKGAADIVLTDDNFATIVEAVREGRGIYANVKKAVHFLLSSNIGEIITIFVAISLGWTTPLLAIHLLWVNLVTDSLPAIALGLDPVDKHAMQRKPYESQKSLFTGGLWQRILLEGGMIGMLSLLAFAFGNIYFDPAGSSVIGRTMAFATLSISQLVHAFNMRSEGSVLSKDMMLGNRYLVGAFVAGLFLQIVVITMPALSSIFRVTALSGIQWLIVGALCVMPIIIVEIEKSINSSIYDYIGNSRAAE